MYRDKLTIWCTKYWYTGKQFVGTWKSPNWEAREVFSESVIPELWLFDLPVKNVVCYILSTPCFCLYSLANKRSLASPVLYNSYASWESVYGGRQPVFVDKLGTLFVLYNWISCQLYEVKLFLSIWLMWAMKLKCFLDDPPGELTCLGSRSYQIVVQLKFKHGSLAPQQIFCLCDMLFSFSFFSWWGKSQVGLRRLPRDSQTTTL